ncbi:MAG: helicase-related protein [Candidatus Bipolaricaulia bacterium]
MNGDGGRFQAGSLVRCRDREWVVLPSTDPELIRLRPLGGGDEEVVGLHRRLVNLGQDRLEPASFPLPSPDQAGDFVSARLLWDAARLRLRDGAGPFRSLGRLSVRPRPYQYVPLLMALRINPVRLLIADDVGIGKTIEGALIAREMLDRGEIERICVLCPPYLADQWQRELFEKFHIHAEVVRSGTAARLERRLPPGDASIFSHYRHLIVSVDYAKSDRHRHAFLQSCPEFVIVDEAHGSVRSTGHGEGRHQRHDLLNKLSSNPERHLLLLTATPHSGVEDSFKSLLGLIDPAFAELDMQNLREDQREALAQHFVQRRRPDVADWLGSDTHFPERDSEEIAYKLSEDYLDLFTRVFRFARELIATGEREGERKRRLRYWTALALLRCVMSSPAAAESALAARMERLSEVEAGAEPEDEGWDDDLAASYVYDRTEDEDTGEGSDDVTPSGLVGEGEAELEDNERRKLRQFAKDAAALKHSAGDTKLTELGDVVEQLIEEGYRPIVWCRYIATSDYVAEGLQDRLAKRWKGARVLSVTGQLTEDERRGRVHELADHDPRVLVATDCLSEGINLQAHFTAVVHYDLPWNPNRMEQREGRVDRFGQNADVVKAVLLYGRDNAIDGAVLDVLLRKARKIHQSLRVYVPVPRGSDEVMHAIQQRLFLKEGGDPRQMGLFEGDKYVRDVHFEWDRDAERLKETRSRFTQRRAINPDDVQRELEETDQVLGDETAVARFVRAASQRLGVTLASRGETVWELEPSTLPDPIRARLGDVPDPWPITFTLPAPEAVTPIGRNHPLVAGLAEHLLETAIESQPSADGEGSTSDQPAAARSGVIRTEAVAKRTTLWVLRLRYLLEEKRDEPTTPMLAEEVVVRGVRGRPGNLEWLDEDETLDLLAEATPAANVSPQERSDFLQEAIDGHSDLEDDFRDLLKERAKRLEEAHRRVRKYSREERVKADPQEPPDVLGVYVLLPVPQGVSR